MGGGDIGPIKRLLSLHIYSKKRELKALYTEAQQGQKAARQRKSVTVEKKEHLL
jgi:hypothetical protein